MATLSLDVFIEGVDQTVGSLERNENGAMSFRYVAEAPHPISLSIPIREEPYKDVLTRGFFSNLLFENAQRYRVMDRYGLEHEDIVGILEHLGADCPGSISCVPRGQGPAKTPGRLDTDYDRLTNEDMLEIMVSLRDMRRLPDRFRDPSPLAGVQGKIALTKLKDGSFALPKTGLNVPTTHILKVPRSTEMAAVAQEHTLMDVMSSVQDHEVAETSIFTPEGADTASLRGLLITRFDRHISGDSVSRIHQEDFAQAAGLGPELKYERRGSGNRRFSAKVIGQILKNTRWPGIDRRAFLELTIANLALGNTDNHAKNHALLHDKDGARLAPVYDVISTLTDRNVTHELAFNIGSAKVTDEITAGDIKAFIGEIGFPRATPGLLNNLRNIVRAAVSVIPDMSGPQKKGIGDGIAEQVRSLSAALDMDLDIPERDAVVINRPSGSASSDSSPS